MQTIILIQLIAGIAAGLMYITRWKYVDKHPINLAEIVTMFCVCILLTPCCWYILNNAFLEDYTKGETSKESKLQSDSIKNTLNQ